MIWESIIAFEYVIPVGNCTLFYLKPLDKTGINRLVHTNQLLTQQQQANYTL
jgi:hypothetical protein